MLKYIRTAVSVCATVTALAMSTPAAASLQVFQGGTAVEAQWRTAAGTTVLETFESFSPGQQISSLPLLGVTFDTVRGGGFPAIYQHGEPNVTPYGHNHLGNFPYGVGGPNGFADISLRAAAGKTLTAVGFWNGDGQLSTMVAQVYDVSDHLLGSISAFKGTFAGFVSDVAVGRVVFLGNSGDGWNHIDGLQANAVPEPATMGLALIGLLALAHTARKPRPGRGTRHH